MTIKPDRLSLSRIERARGSISAEFLNTPQYECESLSEILNAQLVLKIETLNPVRSFKGRGADWYMASVPEGSCVVCASAGNFGQAIAYAARKKGVSVTVYAAHSANPLKLERMRKLGADVKLHGNDFDAARAKAHEHSSATGERLVVDSLDIETAEGAGTIGLELLQLPRVLDSLLIPLGNGAVCAGIACVMKQWHPSTRIIAVQSAGASAMVESLRAGYPVTHDTMHTIADGIATREPIPQALEDLRGLIDDTVLVSDSTILRAMRLLHEHAGIVPEPSAAVGVAVLLEQPDMLKEQRVGSIICGANLTPEQIGQWL